MIFPRSISFCLFFNPSTLFKKREYSKSLYYYNYAIKITKTNEDLIDHKYQRKTTISIEDLKSEEVTFEDIKNSWADIISKLENTNSKTAHFIEEAELSGFDGKQLIIQMTNDHGFHIKTLEKDINNIELLDPYPFFIKINWKKYENNKN